MFRTRLFIGILYIHVLPFAFKVGIASSETYHIDGKAVARMAKNRYIFGGDINKEYADIEHFISGHWS